MIAKYNKWGWMTLAVLALWLAGAASVHAQGGGGRGGGGGGGGGFGAGGGGGGGGARASTTSSSNTGTSARDYPNATQPGEATISLDSDGHGLIVMADDETWSQISQVVATLDRPKPQVLIKVVFLEVQHDNDLDLGVEGTYSHNYGGNSTMSQIVQTVTGGTTNTTTTTTSTPNAVKVNNGFGLAGLGTTGQTIGQSTMPNGAGIYSIAGSDFTATVRAIASLSKVEVISRPSIMVRNNQPATITIGQSVPLITGVTFPSTSSGPVTTVAYQNVGIILQVTPFISQDNLVEMIVAPQISSLSSQTVQIATNVNVPVIDLRSANTVVVTPDGQTVVIGGLIENDNTVIDSKIPLLGDIPYLGLLFQHHQKANTKKELLIFLTPHIVGAYSQLASTTARERATAELSNKAFGEKELDRYFDQLPVKPNTVTTTPDSKK